MFSQIGPQRLGLIFVICALSCLADFAGLVSSWNQRLGDTRMAASDRDAGGQIVVVAVDSQSLAAAGTWPWSRDVHAALLDRLTDAGALDVFFDFDFAFPIDRDGDRAFEAALERAGGATYLAVFEQTAKVADPNSRHYNLPLPVFGDRSWPALVNVDADARGFVRHYPFGAQLADTFVMSAGALLANRFEPEAPSFEIDFSIDPASVPVVSAIDVVRGIVPNDVFQGRSVIIGAFAIELSDQLTVPVRGVLPGPLVHALAAETLIQARAVQWMRAPWIGAVLAVTLLILGRVPTARPVLSACGAFLTLAGVELAAFWLFRGTAVMAPTALLYPALLGFVIFEVARTVKTSNWLVLQRSVEARNTLRLLESVFDDGLDGVVILRDDGSVLRSSASAAKMFGTTPDGALNLPERLRRAKPKPPSAPLQTIEVNRDGELKVLEYRAALSKIEHPALAGRPCVHDLVTTLLLRDITQLQEQERDIAYLSNYDDRTGAMRRNAFLVFLGLRLEGGRDAIVFALTLERMKTVNVTLGRIVGDAILRELVARLEQSSLQLSAPVRLGGTSFAVFTESAADLSRAEEIAQELLEDLGQVYRLKDANAQVGVRIGYACVEDGSGVSAEVALDQAIEAMDAAKVSGAAVARYDHTAWETQKRGREIERAMEPALERGEFKMLYQPQHRVSDGALVGAEALIRWESPTLGQVYPDEFIGIAESTGFIVELGNWTLAQSARDALLLPPEFVISVNVSGIQIMRGNLVGDTVRILEDVGLAAERVCFELTETVMLASNTHTIETMQDLNFLGITWALDDFGTGFSSMEYLSKMPLDKVKLDKSFIMKLGSDPTARPILHSASELCRGLGVKLLCEGVETPEQLAVLSEERCDEAQGYLFGKPLPIDQLLRHAARQPHLPGPQRKAR